MKHLVLLSLAASFSAGLVAQANTVAGLDGRLTVVSDLRFWDRRGPAYPNGEVGMSMRNTMCNPGSVDIPWYAPMQSNHPMFGFIIARVSDDRIEQINEWSYCKHAFLSVNVNGTCGPCQDPGTGSLMGLNCSDTYSNFNNAQRRYLGPPEEIDPWLGTWDPVGSYFDIGDPMQAGFPAPADGQRDLNTSIFDEVDNRVTVDEADLITAGADYYYGIQLLHRGEALANRGDNLAHRGFDPSWNGSSWSFGNNAEGQEYGSILDRWSGASVQSGHNGNDDGRLFVAVKVTPLGGGDYHYEYAVHNVDNSRAAATFRIPIDAAATASNFTFGDLDNDASNDWTATRQGNQIVFDATPDNPLEWNTIYNFGFDADFAPGTSTCEFDAARPGAGASFVSVQTEAPGGATIASFDTFGLACNGSSVIPQPPCAERNSLGGTLANTLNSNEFVYMVTNQNSVQVESFDIWTAATGGPVTLDAHIYDAVGSLPMATPLASTTITIDGTAGFHRATFSSPVSVSGLFFIGVDTSAQTAYVSDLVAGTNFIGYERNASGGWTLALIKPSYVINCVTPTLYELPAMSGTGVPSIGSTYDIELNNALPSAITVLFSGLSDEDFNGQALPAALSGTPNCNVWVAPEALIALATSATGAASYTHTVPNNPALVGIKLFHQWAILDEAANARGIVLSDAAVATVGN